MKHFNLMIIMLTALGVVGIGAGAFVMTLMLYSDRFDYVAIPVVCMSVGFAALVAALVLQYVNNRRIRRSRGAGGTFGNGNPAHGGPAHGTYPYGQKIDPFEEFPDDPFAFGGPAFGGPAFGGPATGGPAVGGPAAGNSAPDNSASGDGANDPACGGKSADKPDDGAGAGKYCMHCGSPRDPKDKFCPFCGHRYDE